MDVVDEAAAMLQKKIDTGTIKLESGVSYKFAGNYEQQVRATKRLVVVPISLLVILLLFIFSLKR